MELLKPYREKDPYVRRGGGISVRSEHPLERMFIPSMRRPDGTFVPLEVSPFEGLLTVFENPQRAYEVQNERKQFVSSEVSYMTAAVRFVNNEGVYATRADQDRFSRAFRSLSTASISLANSPFLIGEAKNQQNRDLFDQEKYESASFQQNLAHAVIYASRPEASDRFVELVYFTLAVLESSATTAVGSEALKMNRWIAGLKNNIAVNRTLSAGPALRDVVIPQPFTEDINQLDRKGIDGLAITALKDKTLGFIAAFDAKYTPGILDTNEPLPRNELLDEIYEGIDPEIKKLYVVDSHFLIGPFETPNGLLTPGEEREIKAQVRGMKLRDMDVPPENMEAYLAARKFYDLWSLNDRERMAILRKRISSYGKQQSSYEDYTRRELERLAKVNAYAHKVRRVR